MSADETGEPSEPSGLTDCVAGQWCLYLLECANGAWYAGITNDLGARYAAHARGRGARFTRANPPRRLIGWRRYPDRASASRAEWTIKRLKREHKMGFLLTGRLPGERERDITSRSNI